MHIQLYNSASHEKGATISNSFQLIFLSLLSKSKEEFQTIHDELRWTDREVPNQCGAGCARTPSSSTAKMLIIL
jgi:hypothetical protein